MVNKQSDRQRIRAAKREPSAFVVEGIEHTLNHLPRRKLRTFQDKLLIATAVAAALALFLVFAAPPIVRAAKPFFQWLFGDMIGQVRRERAVPEDARVQSELEEIERISREQLLDAPAKIGDLGIKLVNMRLEPTDFDNPGNEGKIVLTLEYEKIPPFDPNYIEFHLVKDGVELPAFISEREQTFRDNGGVCRTEEHWQGFSNYGISNLDRDSLEVSSNSYLSEGIPCTTMSFSADDWRWARPASLTLRFEAGGQSVSIPFEYDPERAHAYALEKAKEYAGFSARWMDEREQLLESLEADAVPLGLSGRVGGYEFTITELAYVDQTLYFSSTFRREDGKSAKSRDSFFCGLAPPTVDGIGFARGGKTSEIVDGAITAVTRCVLARDPDKLPETSLIMIMVYGGEDGKEQYTPVAFRYHWVSRKVTLPEGDTEMARWVREAKALETRLCEQYPSSAQYELTPLALSETLDGLTLSPTVAYVYSSSDIRVGFSTSRKLKNFELESDALSVRLNGAECPAYADTLPDADLAIQCHLPMHLSEYGDAPSIDVALPVILKDKQGNITYQQTFRFSFILDRAALHPTEEYHEPVFLDEK